MLPPICPELISGLPRMGRQCTRHDQHRSNLQPPVHPRSSPSFSCTCTSGAIIHLSRHPTDSVNSVSWNLWWSESEHNININNKDNWQSAFVRIRRRIYCLKKKKRVQKRDTGMDSILPHACLHACVLLPAFLPSFLRVPLRYIQG
jgi:hypothetical protein